MAFQPIGTDHLTIAAATQRLDRQAEIINKIGSLHQQMHYADRYTAWDYCGHCKTDWPCATIRIIEAVPL